MVTEVFGMIVNDGIPPKPDVVVDIELTCVVDPPPAGVAHVWSPRRNVDAEAEPEPRRAVSMVPDVMALAACECEAAAAPMSAGAMGSPPAVKCDDACDVGARASVMRESSPAATVPAVVPTGSHPTLMSPEDSDIGILPAAGVSVKSAVVTSMKMRFVPAWKSTPEVGPLAFAPLANVTDVRSNRLSPVL
jgi:hypothetical protein